MTLMTWDFILSGCAAITCATHSRLASVFSRPRWLTTALRSQVKAELSVSRVISGTEAPGPGPHRGSRGQTRAPRLISVRVTSILSSRYERLRESKLLPCKFTEHKRHVKNVKLHKTIFSWKIVHHRDDELDLCTLENLHLFFDEITLQYLSNAYKMNERI